MAFVGDALAEKLSQGEITLPTKIQPNHTELVTALAQLLSLTTIAFSYHSNLAAFRPTIEEPK